MSANHQSCLLKQLDQQRRQELFCDCNVLVEGRLFRAHRNILFGSSGYFRMLLSQGARDSLEPVSVSFNAFSPDVFTTILDFVYSGRLELDSSNVIEVMSAASYLQMDDVIAYCKSFIKSSLEISAKEDDGRYMCLSDGSPVTDGTQGGGEWPVVVGTCGQNLAWSEQEEDQVKDDYQGEATSPQNSSPSQTVLGSALDENQAVQSTPMIPKPRRGARRRSATQHYAPGDTFTVDVQRTAGGAQKADTVYPIIVGVMGAFNKDSSPSMRFKCPFCMYTVKTKSGLKRHLRCHMVERPYPCQACSKRYTSRSHLRRHVNTIHPGEEAGVTEMQTPRCSLGDGRNSDDNLVEDSGTDLIIQEVEDSFRRFTDY